MEKLAYECLFKVYFCICVGVNACIVVWYAPLFHRLQSDIRSIWYAYSA